MIRKWMRPLALGLSLSLSLARSLVRSLNVFLSLSCPCVTEFWVFRRW